jgi:RNA polymerase sigma factor (sigma-70 family)
MTALGSPDDATLATAVAAGDVTALGTIYDRYGERLLGFCRSILRNQAEAEDCLQDVFVIAATRLGGLREPALLRSWLFSVARHVCLGRIDKRKREVLVDEVADRPSFDPDPSASAAVDLELAELLRDAGAGMSDRDRLLLDLADRQQLAGDEFAAAIGVPRSTAYTLLARARTTAKKSIGALLVARTGRGRCDDLDALLTGWDGQLTALRRKQIARHIEKCATCDDQRSKVASAAALFGEGTAFAARLVSLRTSILEVAAAAMREALPVDPWDGGWPPGDPVFAAADDHRRRRGLLTALLVAGLLLLIGGVGVAGVIGPHSTSAGHPGLAPVSVSAEPTPTPTQSASASSAISAVTTTKPTVTTSPSRTHHRSRSASPSSTPSVTPSSTAATSATPTPSRTQPTRTKTKTKATPTPTKSVSSAPPTTAPPTSPPPPPPATWVLTIQPGASTVTTNVDPKPCPGAAGAVITCTYKVTDGTVVQMSTTRAYRFDNPASCAGTISCSFTMTDDETITVHVS